MAFSEDFLDCARLDLPPPPPPPLSLSWRTFAEVAKPSCPAPVADTTKMGVLMVFAKKSSRSLFPDSPVSKNGANDVKCTVRMLGRSVCALSWKANEVFGH